MTKNSIEPGQMEIEIAPGEADAAIQAYEVKYAHVKNRRSSLAIKGAAWSFLNSIVPNVLNSLVFVVSSRYLTPHDFGVVALITSLVAFISAIAPIALGEALIQRADVRKTHLDTVFWVCMASALFIYLVLVALTPFTAQKMGDPSLAIFFPVLGLKLFFDLAATVPNALIARNMSFHLIALRSIVATLISSAVCVSLLATGHGIWALIIAQLAVSVASSVAVLLGARWLPGFDVRWNALRDLLKYGVFASANRFLTVMNLDQILIGSYMGAVPLGIFNFSRRLFQMLNDVIAGALTSVSHALLSSLQNEKEKVRDAFVLATFGSSIISFPAFIGLAAIAGEAIPLIFGSHWSGAVVSTRWFCVIGLMSCIGVIQASLINSQGRSNWWFYYQLFRQVCTLTTIFVLYGHPIDTVVMAMAIQVMLFWPITLVMASRIIALKFLDYFRQFLPPFAASATMFLAILLIQYLCTGIAPVLKLGLEISLGALIYTASIYLLARDRISMILKSFLHRNK